MSANQCYAKTNVHKIIREYEIKKWQKRQKFTSKSELKKKAC